MAQTTKETRSSNSLSLPLHLGSTIAPLMDAVSIGEWVVGYAPPTDERQLDLPKEYQSGDRPLEDWLATNFERLHEPNFGSPELVRRTLMRDWTFRHTDWIEAGKALACNIPEEVKNEIRRAKLIETDKVYLLRAEDFRNEWRLLESLALLSGVLATHRNPILAKAEADSSLALLNKLLEGDNLYRPALGTGLYVSPQQITVLSGPSDSLAKKVKDTVTQVMQSAFWRVLQGPKMQFRYTSEGGPWFDVEIKGQLGLAYLVLLRTFARGWKRCKRSDCGNLFRVTDDTRKIFCSQYCGHLESLRKKRRETRQNRKSRIRRR